MKILEIYKHYKIPPHLQDHMLRAAAVGLVICDHLKDPDIVKREAITQTLLLHDMGNIIKFNFDSKDILYKEIEKEVEYWKKVQEEFKEKYQNDEHIATYEIAKEIGVSEYVYFLLIHKGSSNLKETVSTDDINQKICSYSDLRVGPHGVLTINARWDEVLKRYEGRGHILADKEKSEQKRQLTLELEKQLQPLVHFHLENIDNKMIAKYFQELRKYEIQFKG